MRVYCKSDCGIYNVYDIAYDSNGYPHFLIYKDNQWIRMSAKYCEPIDNDCYDVHDVGEYVPLDEGWNIQKDGK